MKKLQLLCAAFFAVAALGAAQAIAAGQSGCITCHGDDAKMKALVTFIPPLEGEGEG